MLALSLSLIHSHTHTHTYTPPWIFKHGSLPLPHLRVFILSPSGLPPALGLGCRLRGGRAGLRGGDVEDGTDAEEEAAQHGAQLGDQVELHHLTQVGVVTGRVRLKLRRERGIDIIPNR